ncbi:GerMN domain-containing protein [Rathayibacter tanaceti]|uniref:Sporulation and spore germination n=2 Tax=Rathayibacter tanaceti TaxID=1671680 RepID=A0A162GIL2_9MICO|nr:GerMN domain-containing protein [Rathayibacter tanaceti]KZX21779.1 Sporulation and spore germination [Rathayibacter tanaceti]QHC54493.1 hypothetical protein GSU10_01670 [Rathayibacter tanaceti]TCO35013.1 hypothetical protein EV639_10917 [Rathayibacter tanaceti]
MTPLRRLVAVAGLVALVAGAVSGCAGDQLRPAGAPATGFPASESPERTVPVVLVSASGPWVVWRDVPGGDLLQASAEALLAGPTDEERARGITSALPPGYSPLVFTGSEGQVEVSLPLDFRQTAADTSQQIACTAAASPGVPGGLPPAEVVVAFTEPSAPEAEPLRVVCDDSFVVRIVLSDSR